MVFSFVGCAPRAAPCPPAQPAVAQAPAGTPAPLAGRASSVPADEKRLTCDAYRRAIAPDDTVERAQALLELEYRLGVDAPPGVIEAVWRLRKLPSRATDDASARQTLAGYLSFCAAAAGAPVAPPPTATRDAAAVGDLLARAWCRARFGLPPPEPGRHDDIPPCGAVRPRIHEQRVDGVLQSALVELSVGIPMHSEERYLYLEANDVVGAVRLAHALSSGVGAFSHEIVVTNVRVADVTGDETPEWYGEVLVESHDTDVGRVVGEVHRTFVLCTLRDGAFTCAQLPLSSITYEQIDPDPADTGARSARARTKSEGFVTRVAVSREKLKIAITHQPKHSPAPRLTRTRKPPRRGTLSIDSLLKEGGLPMIALPTP